MRLFDVAIWILAASFFVFGVLSFLFGTVGLVGSFHDEVQACIH